MYDYYNLLKKQQDQFWAEYERQQKMILASIKPKKQKPEWMTLNAPPHVV